MAAPPGPAAGNPIGEPAGYGGDVGSSVGRFFARGFLVLVAAVGLLWPLLGGLFPTSSSPANDPVVITEYRAQFDIDADGSLTATEDITAAFPSGRHGIFRYWDVVDAADPGIRYIPTVTGITMDDRSAPYETFWESGDRFLVAKIGDPDRYLDPGEHRYRISYTIPGAISPASAGAQAEFASSQGNDPGPVGSTFLWTVVAQGWEMRIERAVVSIALPGVTGQVQCSAGRPGAAQACAIKGAGTAEVTLAAENLPPRSGMAMRASMALAAPARASLPWSITWDPVLGRSVPVVLLVMVGSGLALLAGIGWARVSHEDPPGFPVQYVPPDGLGPVQVVFMDTEGTGANPLVATLLHMAERGLVRLERPSPDSWSITGIAAARRLGGAGTGDPGRGQLAGPAPRIHHLGEQWLCHGREDPGRGA